MCKHWCAHAWGGLLKETLSPWACNLFCIRFPLMLQPTGFLGTVIRGRSVRSKGFKETPLEEGNFAFPDSELLSPTHPSPNPCPKNCPRPAGAGLIPPSPLLTQEKFPAEGFLRMSSREGELLLHVIESGNSNTSYRWLETAFSDVGG